VLKLACVHDLDEASNEEYLIRITMFDEAHCNNKAHMYGILYKCISTYGFGRIHMRDFRPWNIFLFEIKFPIKQAEQV
jgi:hypothetical protein